MDLRLANFTAPHMAARSVRGVTLGLGYGLARFRELGMHPAEIRLTGGGSNSRIWRQMCADVFGVPTVCLQSGEGAGPRRSHSGRMGLEQGDMHRMPRLARKSRDRLVQVDETSRNEPEAKANKVYPTPCSRTVRDSQGPSEASKLI